MNLEAAIVTISILCLAAAIYLAMLSTQIIDMQFRTRLVNWAVLCLIGGTAILACWLISQTIKRAIEKEESNKNSIF
ncbi:hypothetical protein DRO54_09125 [Candidatus Bathyarchaeota archaeon]|nr:MAG: hypothetical protein DRO54_09125 [Candidatus Bathyarchaeota archaeon]